MASVLDKLVKALENQWCRGCNNRIGWNGEVTQIAGEHRSDYRNCAYCEQARSALADAEALKLPTDEQVRLFLLANRAPLTGDGHD